ncbi:MAG: dihydropteroate synthase [Euryarchaeota archaeon]|nr:dihydropteroate synthase [Euryarchaeota archaeon]
MTIEGLLGGVRVGDLHPVRVMGVINLSQESFYSRSFVRPKDAVERVMHLVEEGADLIDVGAVSTAPGSPPISEKEERTRLIPALKSILGAADVEISVDTQRAGVAEEALSLGASCVNDVLGLGDPRMAGTVAEHGGSLVIMASRNRPGDLLGMTEIITVLGERMRSAVKVGVSEERIILDPGVGRWVPEKRPEHDLAILDGLGRLRALNRPVMAAVSRKSFIGERLNRPDPEARLSGSLAAAVIAVYNGSHVVRTHDVSASLDHIRMAEAIRGRPPLVRRGDVKAEVCAEVGHPGDLGQIMKRIGVGEGGSKAMSGKGAFRAVHLRGVGSMEAVIIKQEMLARGGDAAIPMGALRCDPGRMEVLVLGTAAQIKGLIKNLKGQPFNLPAVGEAIGMAMEQIEDPKRYGW